eukprot:PITA_18974
MGSKIKEEAMKSLIRSDSPDILLIQETKMEDKAFLHIGKNLWKRSEGQAVSARGASGGLGTLWNTNKFMKVCWETIRGLADSEILENIIIVEDLNLTLSLAEKRGGSIVRDPARKWVEDFLQDWDMIDIKPSSGKYTWSNRRLGPGHIAARLDRFFVQSSFLLLGLESRMHILPCSVSNHRPIKLDLMAHLDQGPIPFKFSPLWVKEQTFMQLVKDTWKQPVNGLAFYVWEEKLRRVKAALKTWAKLLPNPATERKKIQNCLEIHQMKTENEVITKEVLDKEAELQQQLLKASLAEEEYWRVKSRRLWLKAGDRNFAFFHKQSQARKNFNSISEIKEGDGTHRDIQSIKNAAFCHFKNLYSEKEDQGQVSSLMDEVPNLISTRKNQLLEAEFTNEEIKATLFAMEPDKAPGPNGFTAIFLQTCWHIVEKDLGRMVRKSQACQKIGGGTNSAFLALIPKEKGANTFSRFRPISLCNIGYKLITKVIANRLKPILPSIIPKNQGGFI